MLANQRQQKILELIQEDGSARVKDLSKTFDVTSPTIRQDLETLEAEGYVTRTHGGAFLKDVSRQVQKQTLHHQENLDKKMKIGLKAAEFIDDGDFIILDSGSTVTELAKCLVKKKDLQIITNALNIALLLGANPSFGVLVTGGEFKAPTLSLTGEKATSIFENLHVNKLFLATAGISFESGLTYPSINDIPVKSAMINSAQEIFLLADSTKIDKVSFAALGSIELINYLITDSGISKKDIQNFEKMGIEVIIAE